jgi:uncharacterized membrane protein YkoI
MKHLFLRKKFLRTMVAGLCIVGILGTEGVIANGGTGAVMVAEAATKISLATAKKKALKDAGLTASKVTYTKAKLDRDDWEYEIEFYTSSAEYEYEIDAYTGDILSKDVEKFKTTKKSSSTKKSYIGVSKAKQIALDHAGLKASQVRFKKAKLDTEDGIRVYEIEFYKGRMEYEYEIDAYTGEILEWDSEYDD